MNRTNHSSARPSVFIVVVNWRNPEATLKCVRSLEKLDYENFKIVIIDNGSNDDSEAVFRSELEPRHTVIQTGDNLGYAGGLRVGAEHAIDHGAELILCLNNDLTVKADSLSRLMEEYKQHGRNCLYAPLVVYAHDHGEIYYAGADLQEDGCTLKSYKHEPVKPDLLESRFCDCVHGCAFMVPTDLIARHGFMDESYFLYGEEVDYCLRMRKEGVRVRYVATSETFHQGMGSHGDGRSRAARVAMYYYVRNALVLRRRNQSGRVYRRYLRSVLKSELRSFFNSFVQLRRPNFHRLFGIWHGIQGRTGRTYRL